MQDLAVEQMTEYGGRCSRPGASSKSSADMVYGYLSCGLQLQSSMRCDGFDFGFCRFPAGSPNVKKLRDKTPMV